MSGVGEAVASAPAKAILLGEHAVNRGGGALVTAVDARVRCHVRLRADDRYVLRAGARAAEASSGELHELGARIDAARERGDVAAIARAGASDFFHPARYVLAALAPRLELRGLDATWVDLLPTGCGLGSGSAAHCALAVAAAAATGTVLAADEVAALAWRGDILAHGGIASALDASGSAFGGVVEYRLETGARPVRVSGPLPLVVADTGVAAPTGAVNAGLARRLAERPALAGSFAQIGLLVEQARAALATGDLETLGRLMHLNQLVLARLGVSSAPIDRLVDAALAAGALGAKLSGSGGGGIVVALAAPDSVDAVAAALDDAGGRTLVARAAVPGAHASSRQPEGALPR